MSFVPAGNQTPSIQQSVAIPTELFQLLAVLKYNVVFQHPAVLIQPFTRVFPFLMKLRLQLLLNLK
jgi:hypothetical protein